LLNFLSSAFAIAGGEVLSLVGVVLVMLFLAWNSPLHPFYQILGNGVNIECGMRSSQGFCSVLESTPIAVERARFAGLT